MHPNTITADTQTERNNMDSEKATPQSVQFVQSAEHFAMDRGEQQQLRQPPFVLQKQVDNVLSLAQSFAQDWKENEGQDDPDCADALECLKATKPSLSQHGYLLHLLVRAAAEIYGNPFLDDGTSSLPAIREFLRQPELQPAVGQAVYLVDAGQTEILDDLLGRDSDDAKQTVAGRFIRAADTEKIASVMMSDIVGAYDSPDFVPEWQWVERNASFTHRDNGDSGVWEHMLNLSRRFGDMPALLKPVIDEARAKGVNHLLFHQGC